MSEKFSLLVKKNRPYIPPSDPLVATSPHLEEINEETAQASGKVSFCHLSIVLFFPFLINFCLLITLEDKKEEALDDLFTYKKGDEPDYFSPEDPEDGLYDFIPSGKGEVATEGNEDEDIEIVETPRDEPIHKGILALLLRAVSKKLSFQRLLLPRLTWQGR